MSTSEKLKTTFERNLKALKLKPSLGQKTAVTKIKLRDGTTCDIEHGEWKFTADVGKDTGGNNAGPGPGVLERAALGSCLAIGYSTWAAVLGVPIEHLEIDVETDVDARGQFGIDDIQPGYPSIRYKVTIGSPAPEEEIMKVLDKADAHSPVLDDFKRPLPVEREVKILSQENIYETTKDTK